MIHSLPPQHRRRADAARTTCRPPRSHLLLARRVHPFAGAARHARSGATAPRVRLHVPGSRHLAPRIPRVLAYRYTCKADCRRAYRNRAVCAAARPPSDLLARRGGRCAGVGVRVRSAVWRVRRRARPRGPAAPALERSTWRPWRRGCAWWVAPLFISNMSIFRPDTSRAAARDDRMPRTTVSRDRTGHNVSRRSDGNSNCELGALNN